MEREFADAALVPGTYVRHRGESGWGLGQVQSVIGNRVTINFEHRGKVIILAGRVILDAVDPSAEESK